MLQRIVEFSHVHKNVAERAWDIRCGNFMGGSKYKPDTYQSLNPAGNASICKNVALRILMMNFL